MKNYYFTFGQNHRTTEELPMKDYWIKVRAENYAKAREIFVREFSSVYMHHPQEWAMQYEEKDFKPDYFPAGEFRFYDQNKLISK